MMMMVMMRVFVGNNRQQKMRKKMRKKMTKMRMLEKMMKREKMTNLVRRNTIISI
jgi:hypothetical protein